jgi:AraC-like DNA-binding protein
MNDIIFFKSFSFFSHSFKKYHYTDMTKGTTCYHIGYLKKGRAEFYSGEEKHEFFAGDIFFIPCGCKYESFWYGEEIVFDSYAFAYIPLNGSYTYKLQKFNVSEKARVIADELSATKHTSAKSIGLLYLFLYEVLPSAKKNSSDKKDELVTSARRYMLLHNEYSITDVARHCRASESALYAAFREKEKHTPIDEKHRIQTEKAVRLLITTDLSVEEISEQLGFSSASYMRKIIKAKTGKTPREIRKEPAI